MIYDVAVIGAGVTGALTTMNLSRYDLKIALLEKEHDVSCGASKANSAVIHAGFDAKPGTLKAKLNVRGCCMIPELAERLNVPYLNNGTLVCAFGMDEISILEELKQRGETNGVCGLDIIHGERLRELEPNLSNKMVAALSAPSSGIISPYELTCAAAENSVINGAELICKFCVESIIRDEGIYIIRGSGQEIKTRYVVNAAGLHSDYIAGLIGDRDFRIIPRRGEYLLLDKSAGRTVSHTVFSVPSDKGKGVLISPTVDGNLIIGPNAREVEKDDTATTKHGIKEISEGAAKLIPEINLRQAITSFAGIRATPDTGDFIIRPARNSPRFIHAAGIESPGLSAAPAIAEYIMVLLSEVGLVLTGKADYNPYRFKAKPFHNMTSEEKSAAVAADPKYGNIVCRCECVTEAEIEACIHSNCPASSLDGIKRRTRAGMGRCQGGFCTPRVTEILSRERGEDILTVTKKGGGSFILSGESKKPHS